MSIGAEIIDKW
jgi:hypothetical protein